MFPFCRCGLGFWQRKCLKQEIRELGAQRKRKIPQLQCKQFSSSFKQRKWHRLWFHFATVKQAGGVWVGQLSKRNFSPTKVRHKFSPSWCHSEKYKRQLPWLSWPSPRGYEHSWHIKLPPPTPLWHCWLKGTSDLTCTRSIALNQLRTFLFNKPQSCKATVLFPGGSELLKQILGRQQSCNSQSPREVNMYFQPHSLNDVSLNSRLIGHFF